MDQKERLEMFSTLRKPQVREVTREDGSKGIGFEGYAIVFNEPSVMMVDWWEDKMFREYIQPEAISQKMLDTTDIVCTAFHNREKLLARHHADGTGTMQLEKDATGVKVSFEFPDSPIGQDIAESVKRGDMPGMSFSFYEDDYTYSDKKGADGIFERTISKINSIFEVTVASSPAYPATTAKCREAWEAIVDEDDPDAEGKREGSGIAPSPAERGEDGECQDDSEKCAECDGQEDDHRSECDGQEDDHNSECDGHACDGEEKQREEAAAAEEERLTRERRLKELESDWAAEAALENRQ